MSFDVKNIEQENLNFKKLGSLSVILILGVVASLIFVYFWFTLESNSIVQDQYLSQRTKDYQKHYDKQLKVIDNYEIDIDTAIKKVEIFFLLNFSRASIFMLTYFHFNVSFSPFSILFVIFLLR